MVLAYVIVTGEASSMDDEEVAGVYEVEVFDEVEPSVVVEVALETFHQKIGISELDDFDIDVVDDEGRPFPGQDREADVGDRFDLSSFGTFNGRVDEDGLQFDIETVADLRR